MTKSEYGDLTIKLRYHSAKYTDKQLIDIAQKAIDFAYENYKEKETVYEGHNFQYEVAIVDIALCLDTALQENTTHKKSSVVKQFVSDAINNEKYGSGRSGFIHLLSILKMDEDLRKIAAGRKDFWESPRIRLQLLHSLYKRKIKGFSKEAERFITDRGDLRKYAKKYMEQEVKWK
jgi:hypothetical protein